MYEIFMKLLQERGITVYRFCKETGVRQSTISSWKNRGTRIGKDVAVKVADFFDVTVDYIYTGNEEEKYGERRITKTAQEMFDDKDMRMLFSIKKDMNPEVFRIYLEQLKALYRLEHPDGEL